MGLGRGTLGHWDSGRTQISEASWTWDSGTWYSGTWDVGTRSNVNKQTTPDSYAESKALNMGKSIKTTHHISFVCYLCFQAIYFLSCCRFLGRFNISVSFCLTLSLLFIEMI